MLDNGYPQSTGDELFKLYITEKGKFFSNKKKSEIETAKATSQVTGAIPWRPPDLKYKKNEIFIDVIESVNVLYSTKGPTLNLSFFFFFSSLLFYLYPLYNARRAASEGGRDWRDQDEVLPIWHARMPLRHER